MPRLCLALFFALFASTPANCRSFIPFYFDPRTWTTWLTLEARYNGAVWSMAACSLQCQLKGREWCNVFRLVENGTKCALAGMSGLYLEKENNANGSLVTVYMDHEDYVNRE